MLVSGTLDCVHIKRMLSLSTFTSQISKPPKFQSDVRRQWWNHKQNVVLRIYAVSVTQTQHILSVFILKVQHTKPDTGNDTSWPEPSSTLTNLQNARIEQCWRPRKLKTLPVKKGKWKIGASEQQCENKRTSSDEIRWRLKWTRWKSTSALERQQWLLQVHASFWNMQG